MDKAVTGDQAYEFIKMLIEVGGKYYIGGDHVVYDENDTPIGVETGIPAKRRPIAIIKIGMKAGDYVVLNPFSDILGKSPERAWFNAVVCAIPPNLVKQSILRAIRLGTDKKKDTGYKAGKFVSKFVDKMDEKLFEEADRIPARDYMKIFYDRTSKTAQLQSELGSDEMKAQYRSRVRKQSWPILVEMLKTILKLPQNKKPESLMYEATIVSIPKVDAILHLVIDLYERIGDTVKALLDEEIPVKELKNHVNNLEMYREALTWFASATNTQETTEAPVETGAAPWDEPKADDFTSGMRMPGGGYVAADQRPVQVQKPEVPSMGFRMPGVVYNDSMMQNSSYGMMPNDDFSWMSGVRMPG